MPRNFESVQEKLNYFFLKLSDLTKKHLVLAVSFLVLLFSIPVSYYGTEYYVKNKLWNLPKLRTVLKQEISKFSKKAVDLEILDLGLLSHIYISDLSISREEDFSFNTFFILAKSVNIKFDSLFAPNPKIRSIELDRVDVTIDIENSKDLLKLLFQQNLESIHLRGVNLQVYKNKTTKLLAFENLNIAIYPKESIQFSIQKGNSLFFWEEKINVSIEYFQDNSAKIFGEIQRLQLKDQSLVKEYLLPTFIQEGEMDLKLNSTLNSVSEKVEMDCSLRSITFFQKKLKDWKGKIQYNNDLAKSNLRIERLYEKEEEFFRLISEEDKDRKWKVDSRFKLDLDKTLNHLEFFSDFEELKGILEGEIRGRETGNKNDWFEADVNLKGTNLAWSAGLLHSKIENFQVSWTPKKEFKLDLLGSFLSNPIQISSKGTVLFKKFIRIDQFEYYPMETNLKTDVTIKSLNIDSFFPAIVSWKNTIQKEIQNRKEKIIPEENFIQTKFFRYFLEYANMEWNWKIQETILDQKKLFALNGKSDVKGGRVTASLKGEDLPKSFSADLFLTYFSPTPSISLGAQIAEIPFGLEIFSLCRVSFLPEKISTSFQYNTFGNDYYALYRGTHFTWTSNFSNVALKSNLDSKLLILPSLDLQTKYNLSFSWDFYIDNEFIKDIQLNSSSVNLAGYASGKYGNRNFSFFGKVGENSLSANFTDTGEKCIR